MPPADREGGAIRDAARRAAADAAAEAAPERTFGAWLEGLVPPEAQLHFLNAGREFVAGVEVTLDHHLGRRAGRPPQRGPVRIEIE
ncbi:MAG TPA: hypothetical protein VG245_03075 [Candidatus Dormibacteraeota bacterium]|nr:hypothetical protein [Candidatus Dormibacteraeota bacterium]